MTRFCARDLGSANSSSTAADCSHQYPISDFSSNLTQMKLHAFDSFGKRKELQLTEEYSRGRVLFVQFSKHNVIYGQPDSLVSSAQTPFFSFRKGGENGRLSSDPDWLCSSSQWNHFGMSEWRQYKVSAAVATIDAVNTTRIAHLFILGRSILSPRIS